MMNDHMFEAGCLCGATRIRVSGAGTSRCYCHCNSCRLASGAPFVAWATFPMTEFRVTRGALAEYQSSKGVTRGFCAKCGTALTYHSEEKSAQIDVSVVTTDDPALLKPEYHIWVSDKLSWVGPDDELPQFAGWRTRDVERN